MNSDNGARIGRNEVWIEAARLFSRRSTCPRGHVGCVIVGDRHIISHGYNGAPPGLPQCDEVGCLMRRVPNLRQLNEGVEPDVGCARAIHAELNAIAFAARRGTAVKGALLYGTHEPCLACAQAIISAGIAGVYFERAYHAGASELLREAGIEVVGS